MSLDGDHLLKRLQPVVRPCGPEFRPRCSRAFEGADFAQLVEMASRGELASGRPLGKPMGSELDEERLDRLSTACDAFEAAGMERGAVLMEGRAFLLAVAERIVECELDHEKVGSVQDIEGVIRVLGPEESAQTDSGDQSQRRMCAIPAVPPGVLAQLERTPGRQTP